MAPPPSHQPGPSTTAAAASSSTSDSSERTGTATPPYMTGIVDERNVVAPTPPTSSNAGLGLQAGPSTNIGGTTMALHSSFIVGTRAARRGTPPFYKAGNPSTAASATSTPPTSPATPTDAPSPTRLLGPMAATDRRSGIRRGTWSPAALGLSSGH
ncbi:nuclear pore complex protein DDB_G0274915-like [Panicum virgatum]|uniref:nuclear pore complex protein DDB_G0274915-like n=1 Tax=Panicum virgatum TaxID=38727 RepID=UPI0019D67317|nr:nuclear pore complex protein DDB_G0274915-like [Panicum virgatum]